RLLPHQPQDEPVAVPLPLGRAHGREYGADDPDDGHHEAQKDADAHEYQHAAGKPRQDDRDVEIERLQCLVGDERRFLAVQQPDDERRDETGEAAQVGEHRHIALISRAVCPIARLLPWIVHGSPPRRDRARSYHHYEPRRLYPQPGWMYSIAHGPAARKERPAQRARRTLEPHRTLRAPAARSRR